MKERIETSIAAALAAVVVSSPITAAVYVIEFIFEIL